MVANNIIVNLGTAAISGGKQGDRLCSQLLLGKPSDKEPADAQKLVADPLFNAPGRR